MWLRILSLPPNDKILSLGGNDKIHNNLVAKPIVTVPSEIREESQFLSYYCATFFADAPL